MIKFENVEVYGWEAAIRGMRNPMNSWSKSDSSWCRCGDELDKYPNCDTCLYFDEDEASCTSEHENDYVIGPNDLKLMKNLIKAGTDHRKFMRMITVYVDITAPLYWWKEFDTYKVGTVANSCSTMHKIHEKEFTLVDFSHEHLFNSGSSELNTGIFYRKNDDPTWLLQKMINCLNFYRDIYLETKDKKYWWQMIQLLPSSYNQKRTVMLNYEVLANIYKSRKNHKLDEWARHSCCTKDPKEWGKPVHLGFCDWIETLPYSELITGLTEIDNVEEMGKCVSEGFREGLMEVVQQNGLLNTYTGEFYLPKEEEKDA